MSCTPNISTTVSSSLRSTGPSNQPYISLLPLIAFRPDENPGTWRKDGDDLAVGADCKNGKQKNFADSGGRKDGRSARSPVIKRTDRCLSFAHLPSAFISLRETRVAYLNFLLRSHRNSLIRSPLRRPSRTWAKKETKEAQKIKEQHCNVRGYFPQSYVSVCEINFTPFEKPGN